MTYGLLSAAKVSPGPLRIIQARPSRLRPEQGRGKWEEWFMVARAAVPAIGVGAGLRPALGDACVAPSAKARI